MENGVRGNRRVGAWFCELNFCVCRACGRFPPYVSFFSCPEGGARLEAAPQLGHTVRSVLFQAEIFRSEEDTHVVVRVRSLARVL